VDPQLLLDMMRENLPCSYVALTNSAEGGTGPIRGCRCIEDCCHHHCHIYPDILHYRCPRTQRSPLHEAAARGLCAHVVRALMDTAAGGPQQKARLLLCGTDAAGNTPLHLLFRGAAFRRMAATEMVEILNLLLIQAPIIDECNSNYNSNPERTANAKGNLPLHVACSVMECMIPLAAVTRLLQVFPAATRVRNRMGQTPLHFHCQRRHASVHVAQELIQVAMDVNSKHCDDNTFRCTADGSGQTELHSAVIAGNTQLVPAFLAADPSAAHDCIPATKRTALHLLFGQQPPQEEHYLQCLSAVKILLQHAPEAATQQDAGTLYTPLHLLLLWNPCSNRNLQLLIMDMVKELVEAAPDALKLADRNRYLPLHHACQEGADFEVISCLLAAYPEAAAATTRKNDTALSLACSSATNHNVVLTLLQTNAAATLVANDYGFLPLHGACRAHRPDVATVIALVRVDPSTVLRRTHAGESAVHLLLANTNTTRNTGGASTSSNEVLAVLLDAKQKLPVDENKKKTSDDDDNSNKNNHYYDEQTSTIGNTPLHYACFRHASVENIEALASQHPLWITARNNAGYSPIMILSKNGRIDERIIRAFARLRGTATFAAVDLAGNTPLHSAMREATNVPALRALIHAFPEALQMRTEYEDTPLHLACLRKMCPEVLREVAHASCATAAEKSLAGGKNAFLSPLLEPNRAGQTPLSIVMEEYTNAFRSLPPDQCCVRAPMNTEQRRSFHALAALVKILHYGPKNDSNGGGNDESLLRACLLLHRKGARLAPAFIRRVLHLCPEDAKIVDDDGNYPLHLEASIPREKMLLLDVPPPGAITPAFCCEGACHKRIGVLQLLMELNPDAAKHRNAAGDFPVSLMVRSGRPFDVTFAEVVRANPGALHRIDNLSAGLVPHLLGQVEHGCGIGALFALVRARPAVLYEK